MEGDTKVIGKDTGSCGQPEPLTMPAKAVVRDIPIDRIRISEFCKRGIYKDIDSLARSIEANGQLQPGGVVENGDGTYTLFFGSRRYLAHKKLDRPTLTCRVFDATEQQAAFLSFAENSEREDPHPVDEARMLERMKEEFGLKDAQLAEGVGLPQAVVAERLAILRLPEDVLAHVDTRHEAPFKVSHALTLSKLMNSNRPNRELEVRELQNKTIRDRLTSTELKELVALFKKDGGFDQLPDSLRTALFNSVHMTAGMVGLYLSPEKAVQGKDGKANAMRSAAKRLHRDEREDLVVKAVRAGRSYEKTRQKLLQMLEARLDTTNRRKPRNESAPDRLVSCVSVLCHQLVADWDEIAELAKANPVQLGAMRDAIVQLQKRLHPFEVLIGDAIDGVELKAGEKVEVLANVSMG